MLNGGCAFIKTADGLTARVGGVIDIPQARTTELGAVLVVRNVPGPASGGGVHSSTLVDDIEIHGSIFITRTGASRPTLPTIVQFALVPHGAEPEGAQPNESPVAALIAHPSTGSMVSWNLWPSLWPSALVRTYEWLFNLSSRVIIGAGHFAAQGTMIKLAWTYPMASLPLCLGCISLGMVYMDVSPGDVAWGLATLVATWF